MIFSVLTVLLVLLDAQPVNAVATGRAKMRERGKEKRKKKKENEPPRPPPAEGHTPNENHHNPPKTTRPGEGREHQYKIIMDYARVATLLKL